MADNLIKSIGPVDDLPLFKLATSIVMEAPGKLGGLAVRGLNAAIEGANAVFETVSSTAMGAVSFGGSLLSKDSPSVEVARAPEKEVSAPAASRASQYEASITDLGTLSSPSFSVASVQSGLGRG